MADQPLPSDNLSSPAHRRQASRNTLENFEQFVVSPGGSFNASLPIAASRAGAIGLLDLTYLRDARHAARETARLARLARGAYGLLLHARLDEVTQAALDALGDDADAIVLQLDAESDPATVLAACRSAAQRVGLVVTSQAELLAAHDLGVDFVVAKGHEAGGLVGDETTFVLLQRLMQGTDLPVVAWGGIGLRTVAACQVAGAAGVALDWQLALTRESPIPTAFRRRLAAMDGSETIAVAGPGQHSFRLYTQPGYGARARLELVSDQLRGIAANDGPTDATLWEETVCSLLTATTERERLWPLGQDAAFAARFAAQAPTVAKALALLREHLHRNVEECRRNETLAAGSPLAVSHRTEYPVVQGPMTRVSDVAAFAKAVAEGGGLPFLALALMPAEQVRKLLLETRQLLGDQPWGVGVLGFVDRELRSQQFAVIEEVCPPFALIAGGRPDQAASLEARGIRTYLHVPSPGMLGMFLSEGARRFVFEGRECGGHVGPRSSFVLWESMIDVLLEAGLTDEQCGEVHVLFAGGIHDSLGGAMVSALAQPLIERGIKVGVLLGTGYLFTHEIVSTGAIVPGFQQEALRTERTVLLETGPGHATRCAETTFYHTFEEEKLRLKRSNAPAERIREELEHLNLGRLRIASKGITRKTDATPGESPYRTVGEDEQHREGMYMIGQVAGLRRQCCTIRELHEEVCAGAVRRLADAKADAPLPVHVVPEPPPTLDIAIVGMSCLLPGALDVLSYWRNILESRDVLTEIPEDRFDWQRWFDPQRGTRDKIYSRWGGFLQDVPFDPLKYGIPPNTLRNIEPMQLLALVLVDQVLRDAGYERDNPYKERTSVIFGAGGGIAELGANYALRAMLPQVIENPDESVWSQLPEWTEDSFAGILMNVVSGRISNRFDFGGVNYTVDAACASSLSAVYLACRELVEGTSDLVISGGCDTLQSPFTYLCFGTAGALSPRGKSRTFDADSDGIAISEGLAAIALKRRADAERDGDRIYAVIRAVAGGSDGRSKGMTAPRPEGQLRTLQRAYAQARFSPSTVELFEAHGTGTRVGDQTECRALGQLLASEGAAPRRHAIGSVKSMMGHTKCTAGVAGLIKAALSLHYQVLPPTMHVERPNADAGLLDGALYVNSELRPWIRRDHPRRAGISSFGFGGTNFHAVLEEYDGHPLPTTLETPHRFRTAELFQFADNTPAGLARKVDGFAQQIRRAKDAGVELDLPNLAFTWHGRQGALSGSSRAALVVSSVDDLLDKLAALAGVLKGTIARQPLPPGVHYTEQPLGGSAPLAFLFPGQGSQWVDMLRDLAVEFSEVRSCFETADAALAGAYDRPLSHYIFPPPAFDDEERRRAAEELKATDVLQPALGACDLGMLRLLASFGIEPALVAGHSYGELVALCAAGCLDEPTLYRLSLARGRAIVDLTATGNRELGGMLAVRAPELQVKEILADCPEVWLANINSPKQTIVAGTQAGLARATEQLQAARLAASKLPVACAFHSPLMEPARQRFAEVLAGVDFAPPAIDVFSNTTGATYGADADDVRTRLTDHLTGQVQFTAEIEAMYAAGARLFVEVGPNRVLSKLTDDILGQRPHLAVATQPNAPDGYARFLTALAQLIAHGVAVDCERLYQGRAVENLDLAALAKSGASQPGPHTWLINGGYVRPASEPRRRPVPQARLARADDAPAHPSASPSVESSMPPAKASIPVPPVTGESGADRPSANETRRTSGETVAPHASQPQPSPGAVAPPRDERFTSQPAAPSDAALAEFQQTMRMFLQTQESVLNAYFAGETTASDGQGQVEAIEYAPHEATLPQPAPAEAVAERPIEPASASPPAPPSTPSPAVVPIAESTPSSPSAPEVEAPAELGELLVNIVSDRTGYPSEMLSLDVNLEADLGIDSIKRVEIIGAFRRAAVPSLDEPPAWFMERVSGAGTLQEILDGVSELAGQSPGSAAAETPAAPQPSEAATVAPTTDAAPTLGEMERMLVEVVSDRTGYPSDMLAMEANLEADLGIDSIKRVEIIGAFRRAVLPSLEEPPAWFMERISGAGTLQEILEGVSALAGSSDESTPPPASADGRAAQPVEPAPQSAAVSPQELESVLMNVISDRTGYPPEMLDPEANLEADLGIDSIKRVEIIGAFRRAALPSIDEPPAWFMEQMTAANNMRAILDGVRQLAGGVSTSAAAAPTAVDTNGNGHTSPPAAPADACPRCVATVVDAPPVQPGHVALPPGAFLLTDDGGGLAAKLAEDLQRRGHASWLISTTEIDSPSDAAAVIERLRGEGPRIAGLIHLAPLTAAPSFPEIDRPSWQHHFNAEVRSLLFLLQALAPELNAARDGNFWVMGVSHGGGDFGAAGDATHPWRGALAGLFKTAAKEWPQARFRTVDVDRLAAPADWLLEEFSTGGPVEIGYRDGQRLAIQPMRVELPQRSSPAVELDADSVVLVTGGARGITAHIALDLAERTKAKLILLGRSALPDGEEDPSTASLDDPMAIRQALIAAARKAGEKFTPKEIERRLRRLLGDREIRNNLAALRAAGSDVQYVSCDVRDEAALKRVVDDCLARFGRLDLVIHGAGIIDDHYIVDKTPESFDAVVGTKLDPLLTLVASIPPSKLRALALFSSVAGFFGNAGQCDYAGANEVLNRVARRLRDVWPGRVVAFNWGPWSGAGMVTPEVAQQFEARGVGLIPVEAGRRVVLDELLADRRDESCLLYGPGPWLADAMRLASTHTADSISVETPLLAGHAVRQLTEGGIEARVVLDAETQPYLRDHMIDDRPVLPAAVALELMAEAAQAAAPAGWHITHVENVRMFAGVVLNGPRYEVVLRAEPLDVDDQGGQWRVRIVASGKVPRPHYESIVRLAATAPTPPPAPELPRISEPFPLDTVDEAYRRWLFHGPLFRGIQELRGLDASGIDAVIGPSCPRQCLGRDVTAGWLIDPVVLDVCPQFAMLWSRATFDTSPLPNRVAVYHRYGPLGDGPVEALFRVDATTDESSYKADVWLIRDNQVIGLMEGLEGAGSAALNRIAGSSTR